MSVLEFTFPMRHLQWWLGLALIILAVVAFVLYRLEKRRAARVELFAAPHLSEKLVSGYSATMRKPLIYLTIAATAALLIALAQPRWGSFYEKVTRPSRDIIICLDTSESMRAENPLPNRLARAKQKIEALMEMAPADRFGLIVFSGAAELQCPLTLDHGYFRAVLNAITTDTISLEGTDIAAAIDEAATTIRKEGEESGVTDKNLRAILIISDGEQVSGDAIMAAREASDVARVHVMGVGDPDGTEVTAILTTATGTKEYVHFSKLDKDTLMEVAKLGGGGYHDSTPNDADVEWMYEQFEDLERRTTSNELRVRKANRFQWFLAAAILLFMFEALWLIALPVSRRFLKGGDHA